jgi:hypothetical protein
MMIKRSSKIMQPENVRFVNLLLLSLSEYIVARYQTL